MDNCFRIAIWMFLLSGCFQAMPLNSHRIDVSGINMVDLGFDTTLKDVLCRENVTFVSPASVPINCPVKALRVVKAGLDQAASLCDDEDGRTAQTIEALHEIPNFSEMMESSNHTSPSEETRKPFAGFLVDCQSFFQRLKSQPQESEKSR